MFHIANQKLILIKFQHGLFFNSKVQLDEYSVYAKYNYSAGYNILLLLTYYYY